MTGAEPLQYAWEFPPGTVAKGSGALQMITWRSGVEPWARVTVSNSRGDATVLSDIDTDTDTDAELALSLSVDTQDRFARAPTRASVSWTVSGLRKAERIVSALFWSNGAHVGSSLGEPLSIAMPSPGARRIDAEILTDQGRRVRTSSVVEVYDGDPPVCRVGLSGDWTLYLEAIADCAVARGELRGYRWSIVYADDGSVRDFGVRDGRLLIESAHLKRGVSEIRLIGYDDRGVASREVKRRRRDGAARR